jgi:hypothetical protein
LTRPPPSEDNIVQERSPWRVPWRRVGATLGVPAVLAAAGPVAHVILAVIDSGTPSLTSYRRIILTIQARSAR